jgi:hypothetical protein
MAAVDYPVPHILFSFISHVLGSPMIQLLGCVAPFIVALWKFDEISLNLALTAILGPTLPIMVSSFDFPKLRNLQITKKKFGVADFW